MVLRAIETPHSGQISQIKYRCLDIEWITLPAPRNISHSHSSSHGQSLTWLTWFSSRIPVRNPLFLSNIFMLRPYCWKYSARLSRNLWKQTFFLAGIELHREHGWNSAWLLIAKRFAFNFLKCFDALTPLIVRSYWMTLMEWKKQSRLFVSHNSTNPESQ